jgi:predicted transposase YdaD
MRDSSTYMAILEEGEAKGRAEGEMLGRAEEARRILLRIGEKRFGPPDPATRTRIESITELDEPEALTLRVIEVESWAELLTQP